MVKHYYLRISPAKNPRPTLRRSWMQKRLWNCQDGDGRRVSSQREPLQRAARCQMYSTALTRPSSQGSVPLFPPRAKGTCAKPGMVGTAHSRASTTATSRQDGRVCNRPPGHLKPSAQRPGWILGWVETGRGCYATWGIAPCKDGPAGQGFDRSARNFEAYPEAGPLVHGSLDG